MLNIQSCDLVIGDLDYVYVRILCRIWPGNALKHSYVGG